MDRTRSGTTTTSVARAIRAFRLRDRSPSRQAAPLLASPWTTPQRERRHRRCGRARRLRLYARRRPSSTSRATRSAHPSTLRAVSSCSDAESKASAADVGGERRRTPGQQRQARRGHADETLSRRRHRRHVSVARTDPAHATHEHAVSGGSPTSGSVGPEASPGSRRGRVASAARRPRSRSVSGWVGRPL